MTQQQGSQAEVQIYETTVNHRGLTCIWEGKKDAPFQLQVGEDMPWTNLEVWKLQEKCRFVVVIAATVYLLVSYWSGMMRWSMGILDGPYQGDTTYALAWTSFWSADLLIWLNVPPAIGLVVKLIRGKFKKDIVYHWFERLLIRLHKGDAPFAPIVTKAQVSQQFQIFLANVLVPTLMGRYLIPWVAVLCVGRQLTDAEQCCLVLQVRIVTLSGLACSAWGLCNTRLLPCIEICIGKAATPPQVWQGMRMVKLSCAYTPVEFTFDESTGNLRMQGPNDVIKIRGYLLEWLKTGDWRCPLLVSVVSVLAIPMTWTLDSPVSWIGSGFLLALWVLINTMFNFVILPTLSKKWKVRFEQLAEESELPKQGNLSETPEETSAEQATSPNQNDKDLTVYV